MEKTMRTAIARKAAVIASCGLLEKSYFCSIANNAIPKYHRTTSVVICLKNRTFAVSQTTTLVDVVRSILLWFAWKIVLLQYRKQRSSCSVISRLSCDLLEKSYFCSIANNRAAEESGRVQLWFAWKIVLLQYRKQLGKIKVFLFVSCDLLEKSYFCSIANNQALGVTIDD